MVNLALSNKNGDIFEIAGYKMTGSSGNNYNIPGQKEIIPLPPYSQIFYLEGASPVVLKGSGKYGILNKSVFGKKLYPVSAFLPPGYLRLYFPAYKKTSKRNLPLWAYTAAGIKDGKLFVLAVRIDKSPFWEPDSYDDNVLIKKIKERIKKSPKNRLLKQLKYCALYYHCFTAKNVFLEKNECAIPVSDFCNASCRGCISNQDDSDFPSSQERINFTPSLKEILEIALYHIECVKDPIISFGQGCEGEPLLKADLIESAISEIRKITKKGTININTNGSLPDKFKKLCKAGLDSCRVSINSVQKNRYENYYRPRGFSFEDVIKTISIGKKEGQFVSINLLTFPGVTDDKIEVSGLLRLIKDTDIDMLQLRNLNIDPMIYLKVIKKIHSPGIGLINLIDNLCSKFPKLRIGYFNIPKQKFSI